MNIASEILIPLLAAHFISDFTLQSERMVREKRRFTVFSLHILITLAAAYVAMGNPLQWKIPIAVAGSHALIDLLKGRIGKSPKNDLPAFAIDQIAHIAVVFSLSIWAQPWLGQGPFAYATSLWYLKTLIVIIGYIATTAASGILVHKILSKTVGQTMLKPNGMLNAGRYIGYLERILLAIFVLQNQFAAAGFLVAAKSVFRFGDINSEDRRHAEYILIGTLLSFTIGILVAILIRWLWNML